MSNLGKEMGRRIKDRYRTMNISQLELSKLVNISPNHLSSIINGVSLPSLPVFIKICKVLSVTPDYLLLGTMSSNNVTNNIVDSLRLCNDDDLDMIYDIIQLFIARHQDN